MSGRGGDLTAVALAGAPLVDDRGLITPAWYRLIVSLISRTGGATGKVVPDNIEPQTILMGMLEGPAVEHGQMVFPQETRVVSTQFALPQETRFAPALPVWEMDGATPAPNADTITLGASPASYVPGHAGTVVLSGGTVSLVEVSRNGSTFLDTGLVAGMFPLEANDTLRITYAVVPTVNFLRRAS